MFSTYLIPMLTGVVGLVMLFAAEPIVKVLVVALGIFLVISGLYLITETAKLIQDKNFKINVWIRGGLSIVLGLLCVILPLAMVNFAWKIMMIVLGIYGIMSAASEIATIMKLSQEGMEVRRYVIEVIGTILASIVLFMIPSSFGFTLIKIGGIVLILIAIVLAIGANRNQPIIEADAEVVDEE